MRHLIWLTATLCLVSVSSPIGARPSEDPGEPLLREKPIYVAGTDEVNIFRIPSLLVTREGTLLAFAEARAGGDKSPTDLVVKRSRDHGRTWSKMRTVLPGGGGAIMNPTPVVDRSKGTLFMVCNLVWRARKLDRILVLTSTDDGMTWSEPNDITDAVGPVHPGPGAGIQLRSGRLVIPGRSTDNRGQSLVIYSDDHGKTWTAGEGMGENTNESSAVELADGKVMLNARSTRGKGCRAVATSEDGGQSWGPLRDDTALVGPVCAATVVRHSLAENDVRNRLLFANPAQPQRGNRTRLTVKLSYDEGQTWPVERVVHPGPSAYSCLAVLPDGTIGLLYEGGPVGRYDSIIFARMNLAWLTEGQNTTP